VEILISVAVVIAFVLAAWFWGADSRPGLDDYRAHDQRPHRWI
jgi:nitrogen fixation-related uncharacterized protein